MLIITPLKALSIGSLCLLSISCATLPERTPLAKEDVPKFARAEKKIVEHQKNIKIAHPDQPPPLVIANPGVSGMAGGLAGGLVVAAIIKYEENQQDKSIAPLQALIKENELSTALQHSLGKELKQSKLFRHDYQPISIVNVSAKNKRLNKGAKTPVKPDSKPKFTVDLAYYFNANLDTIEVIARPRLLVYQDDKPVTLYKNRISYDYRLPSSTSRKAKHIIAQWEADNGLLIHQAFTNAASKIARLIVQDLQELNNETVSTAPKPALKTPGKTFYNVVVLEQHNDEVVARLNNGTLIVTPGTVIPAKRKKA